MKIKRTIIAAVLAAGVLFSNGAVLTANAVTQSEIDALKAERDKITAQRMEKQAVVDRLEAEKASVVDRKQAMDERNSYTLQQMELNREEIELYDQMILEKELEVTDAETLEKTQLTRYRSRIRAMEENGNLNLIAIVLNSDNLSELMTAFDDIGEIMQSDKAIEKAYRAAKENTEQAKQEYEEVRLELTAKREELEEEQVELQADIDEATQLILDLEFDLENRQREYEEIMAAEDAANAVIDQLVAQLEAERKAAEEAANAAGGGGGGGTATATASFVWPVASYVYISSRFGMRVHPITGQTRSHTGLDIASNQGTSVYAADGGKVTMAGWNGGYGNCIMIDHGNGYVTLYGHLNGFAISQGDTVSQGQTIGYVGSTGTSTGSHLHFEVLLNGSRIDPEQFFGGLTFSPDAGV